MKDVKEFKTLWNLLGKDKFKLVLASTILFIANIAEIFVGYLNGRAVDEIVSLNLKSALFFLVIYFLLSIICDGFLTILSESMLLKVESKLTRKLGFETYKKAINLPAKAYEKLSSGEVINRITYDADTLSFAFKTLLKTINLQQKKVNPLKMQRPMEKRVKKLRIKIIFKQHLTLIIRKILPKKWRN